MVSLGVYGALLAWGANARADVIFYAMAFGNQFGTLDAQTGAFTPRGILTGIQGGLSGDITRSPAGVLYGEQSDHQLVSIDPVGLTSTPIGNTGNGIFAIKYRPDGVLFGASNTDLYTIDPATGLATHIGVLGVPTSSYYDLAFDPSGNLFFTESAGSLYSVNTQTGAATVVGPIGFAVVGAEFGDGELYGFTTGSQVIKINTTTGAGTVVAMESGAVTVFAAAPSGLTTVGAGGAGGDAGGGAGATGAGGIAGAPGTIDGAAGGPAGSSGAVGGAAGGASGSAIHPVGASSGCSCNTGATIASSPASGIGVGILLVTLAGRRRRARPRS